MRRRRPEEKEEVIPNWSELCPDLLRCVFKGLSFTDLNRAKSVCSSWHTASRGCEPKPNQIPWLILFPRNEEDNNSNCVLFVPNDKENVYKTRDLRVDFFQCDCLATYGSWLLMSKPQANLYILNPLTGERIDLANTKSLSHRSCLYPIKSCFWIDDKTKDYLVVLMVKDSTVFTNKGDNKWHEFSRFQWDQEMVYNHKNQKLYIYYHNDPVNVWDFSGEKQRKDGILVFNHYESLNGKKSHDWKTRIAVTVSGDVLNVTCFNMQQRSKQCDFWIYKTNHAKRDWVKVDSLGDEALILDMGFTVVAKDISGIKRNSIYFSGMNYGRNDQNHIFVFDLTTRKIEPLPQCVFSSIHFYDARWFFPDFSG